MDGNSLVRVLTVYQKLKNCFLKNHIFSLHPTRTNTASLRLNGIRKKSFFASQKKGYLINPGPLYLGLVKDDKCGSFDIIQSNEFHEHKLAEIRVHQEVSTSKQKIWESIRIINSVTKLVSVWLLTLFQCATYDWWIDQQNWKVGTEG